MTAFNIRVLTPQLDSLRVGRRVPDGSALRFAEEMTLDVIGISWGYHERLWELCLAADAPFPGLGDG